MLFRLPHCSILVRGLHTSTRRCQIVLRPYQEECIQSCVDALTKGATRIGVSLPTGSGKTTVFISLLARILPPPGRTNATRALIIVNSVELAKQSAEQLSSLFPSWTVEIEQGTKHHASGLADVTVATYQTLSRETRLSKFSPINLKAIIVDEAHHSAAPSYRRLLSHFDRDIIHPDTSFVRPLIPHKIPIIGFSATFSRHDGLALGSVFERIVYHQEVVEMIKDQWLCDIRFTSVRANLNLGAVSTNSKTGDFNPTSLAKVINTDTMNDLVVKTWLDRAVTRKSTLIFCVNIDHVESLTQVFRTSGVDARCLSSKTPSSERKALITSFKAGEFPVLINCAILTEGTDIPNIDCVIIARPTRSKNLFAQMIGRGMRLSPTTDKQDCRIIDFVDGYSRGSSAVTAPTLYGLDPGEIEVDDETPTSLEQRIAEKRSQQPLLDIPSPKSVTYVDHEDPFGFAGQSSGAPHIYGLSNNAWVGVGNDVYILDCLGKGHIRIERVISQTSQGDQEEYHFRAIYTPVVFDKGTAIALKLSPYMRGRKILTASTLADAVRGCDTFATAKVVFGRMALGLRRFAPWRKTPATFQQKLWVAKRFGSQMGLTTAEREVKSEKIANMTKGEAANIITRLKHGAMSRYEKSKKAELKAHNLAFKEERRKAREHVQVGALQVE